jgi:hypothetical protein
MKPTKNTSKAAKATTKAAAKTTAAKPAKPATKAAKANGKPTKPATKGALDPEPDQPQERRDCGSRKPEVADKLRFASLLSISIFAALCSAGGGLLGFLSQSRGPSI